MDHIRFLPSYVGSKRAWVDRLAADLQGRPMAELFCGSATLSANLASRALLVDLDPMVYRILSRFDEQIVPDVFTRTDYYRVRGDKDWWRYAFCLTSISFSGVFRYSDSGFNVPAKGGADEEANRVNQWSLRPAYESALARWHDLAPTVLNESYLDVTADRIESVLGSDAVVVLDPPYEGSKAAYNTTFDYDTYWARAAELSQRFTTVLFDRATNLTAQGYPLSGTRTMRVNGARAADQEGASLICLNGTFDNGLFDLATLG